MEELKLVAVENGTLTREEIIERLRSPDSFTAAEMAIAQGEAADLIAFLLAEFVD